MTSKSEGPDHEGEVPLPGVPLALSGQEDFVESVENFTLYELGLRDAQGRRVRSKVQSPDPGPSTSIPPAKEDNPHGEPAPQKRSAMDRRKVLLERSHELRPFVCAKGHRYMSNAWLDGLCPVCHQIGNLEGYKP